MMRKEFISPKEAEELFGIKAGTLANMRVRNEGPAYYKGKRRVLYSVDDFRAWVTANPVQTKGAKD
jgi:hypothetical protein